MGCTGHCVMADAGMWRFAVFAAVVTQLHQASVMIPGMTINITVRIATVLFKTLTKSKVLRQWGPVFSGLTLIPFIVAPIDHAVDDLLDSTLRTWIQDARSQEFDE